MNFSPASPFYGIQVWGVMERVTASFSTVHMSETSHSLLDVTFLHPLFSVHLNKHQPHGKEFAPPPTISIIHWCTRKGGVLANWNPLSVFGPGWLATGVWLYDRMMLFLLFLPPPRKRMVQWERTPFYFQLSIGLSSRRGASDIVGPLASDALAGVA